MKTVTVKIGSSVLLTQRNKLDEFRIAHIADQILSLEEKEVGVVLVVSGAVACGANYIQFSSQDKKLKMAAAGIGQAYLNSIFQQIFSRKGLQIAQILLTKDLLDSRSKKKEINDLIHYYILIGVVPVINENDVIDLNSFGGNDFLAANMAKLLKADQLLILSTMTGSKFGVAGGEAKIQTVAMLKQKNIQASIVDGKTKNILLESIV
jgi:glutamate 5-kinase